MYSFLVHGIKKGRVLELQVRVRVLSLTLGILYFTNCFRMLIRVS